MLLGVLLALFHRLMCVLSLKVLKVEVSFVIPLFLMMTGARGGGNVYPECASVILLL